MNCPACGFANSPTANFCIHCKAPLAPQVADLAQKILARKKPADASPETLETGPPGNGSLPPWQEAVDAALDRKAKGPVHPREEHGLLGNFRDREFVRAGQEAPTLAETAPATPVSLEHQSLVERTLDKIKRAQPAQAETETVKLNLAEIKPEEKPMPALPLSLGNARKPRKNSSTEAARVERIEINLNQPLLPFDGAPPTAGPAADQVPAGLQAAPLLRRFSAGFIDLAFIAGCFLLFLLMVLFLPEFTLLSKSSLAGLVLVALFIAAGYICLFTFFAGKTLGMEHERLRVVNFSGRFPSLKEIGLRSFGYLISGGCFGLGFIWALFDAEKLAWHDRISRTLIVSIPSKPGDFSNR